jgi:hypothetical protein
MSRFQLSFNASLKADFQGSRVTSDGGLIDNQIWYIYVLESWMRYSAVVPNPDGKHAPQLGHQAIDAPGIIAVQDTSVTVWLKRRSPSCSSSDRRLGEL